MLASGHVWSCHCFNLPSTKPAHAAAAESTRIFQRKLSMTTTTAVLKDPMCGMTVNEETALRAERDGKTYYFCGEHCRTTFLALPADTKVKGTKGGCCG